jgi:hypothetical protein
MRTSHRLYEYKCNVPERKKVSLRNAVTWTVDPRLRDVNVNEETLFMGRQDWQDDQLTFSGAEKEFVTLKYTTKRQNKNEWYKLATTNWNLNRMLSRLRNRNDDDIYLTENLELTGSEWGQNGCLTSNGKFRNLFAPPSMSGVVTTRSWWTEHKLAPTKQVQIFWKLLQKGRLEDRGNKSTMWVDESTSMK